jgi:hypothetical protein
MSEHEYKQAIETIRRECNAKLRKYESSRDYWKFIAILLFFISLFWILYLLDCFPDLN